MSEDLKTRMTSPEPEAPGKPKSAKLDLSVSKVVGGALAAMTAAGLGSRLSVAGTLVGAALASVIAAVAGAIYTASLTRTHERVRTVLTSRSGGPQLPTSVEEVSPTSTTRVPQWGDAGPTASWPAANLPPAVRPSGAAKLNWKGIVVGALAIFAIAAAALTTFELVTGHALSGGRGTTITQVTEPKAAKPSAKPSSTPTRTPSASSTPSATPTASAEPTSSASATPTPPLTPPDSSASTPSTAASQTPSVRASQVTPGPSAGAGERPSAATGTR